MGATSDPPAAIPHRTTRDFSGAWDRAASPREQARARLLRSLADEPALRAFEAPVAGAPPDEEPRPAARVAFLRASSEGAAHARDAAAGPLRARSAPPAFARVPAREPVVRVSWRAALAAVCEPFSELRRRLRAVRPGVRLPAQVVVLGLVSYLVLINFSVVRGSSMFPGIRDGDRILIDQVSYLFRDVQRGDVVVLRYPLDPNIEYIKRVVGLPGDDVVIRRGEVIVNGVKLDEPYVHDSDPRAFLSTIVQQGHYFVLGDNRPQSADSREFGQVPRALVRGKVDLRVWPFQRLGLID